MENQNSFNILLNNFNSFIKKVSNNYLEKSFFNFANQDFKNHINNLKILQTYFINMSTYINSSKNICIIDINLILIHVSDDNSIKIQNYFLNLFSKNFNKVFNYYKLNNNEYILEKYNLENLEKIKNIDVLTKKNTQYFNYNISKVDHSENLKIVNDIILNILTL